MELSKDDFTFQLGWFLGSAIKNFRGEEKRP